MAKKLNKNNVDEIIRLRIDENKSIKQIAKITGFCKATISKYCNGLRENNNLNPSNAAAAIALKNKWHKKREKVILDAKLQWKKHKNNSKILSLIAFYWAEGGKRSTTNFALCNSDPGIITSCIKSLTKIGYKDLYITISIYDGQDANEAKLEWQKATGIVVRHVYVRKQREKHKLYSKHGVAILYHKKPFVLFHSIMTWIDCWRKDMGLTDSWQL